MKVGVIGCLGRMGKKILNELITNTKVEIAGAVARADSKYISLDIGPITGHSSNLGIKVTSSVNDAFESSDIVIDFTTKECMLDCLKAAVKFKKPLVSGTTGIEGVDLKKYAAEVPILWSANMSIGVNVLLKLVKKAAGLLGNEYDAEIWEMHHHLKKDSPSGTAIELGKAIASSSKRDFQLNQYLLNSSNLREKGKIGFAVSRGGGVIGDHSVMFVNSDERIELNHKAIDRTAFAKGAVQAAIWLHENKRETPGLYSMQDVI
ncbi:4-hydroxy-tetrahydrodipicolinate reductase [Wolbachia endosymbiont of Atemnus politus]|uniref:4-hydroxy-tetrahydrodipicolinate reductase n=1 Tax=Wolbachia endosymbiont of Atemnus politus TaxID=2682840 RepID=UPI0015745723|nr:4-hydroxy-tetrahydrodipicolinate reductase [Wolbachia endosymbiont of Atemnus politus]NSM56333.1 4-hydroxy-tetrahydrodipicolinate reductase [Wolbachia endosymbiont of Atemnus politus]NSX83301.1 4-hydroxy-tetrahydrodipicolinate reductase [Wolbachia endosymbiont of Atemnus politus]